MNQILITNLNDKNGDKKYISKKFFNIQLIISIIAILAFVIIYFIYLNNLNNNEKLSSSILDNYNISRLYSNNSGNLDNNNSLVFCTIEIPKLNISYPVFSTLTDELLKISPCKFYGNSLKSKGNLCIAGHNYDNKKFFSTIKSLSTNDEIILTDNNGNIFKYYVFDNYEVLADDFSPIYNFSYEHELTLITCNNLNNKRIIIKAKNESI